MLEIALAAAVALVLLVTAAGEGAAHPLYLCGAAAVLAGLAAGIPAGIAYHVALFRAVSASGDLPGGWWWHPTRLHERLPAGARAPVLRWFHVGATGFALAIAGCALILVALLAR